MTTLGRLGGVYALLHASHTLADYWVQTGHQADAKDETGWPGRRACAAHVATLTATQGAALLLGALAAGERLDPRRVAAGLAFNALTHYAIDRREPMRRLAQLLAPIGKHEFHNIGIPADGSPPPCLGTGAHYLDQALHIPCLAITAGIITRH